MKNLLLIGDSIRVGYDKSVKKSLEGRANVLFPEENCRFASYLLRNFHYNDANVNRKTNPILDAIRYYAEGDYNRNDHKHTSDVINRGKEVWKDEDIQKWYKTRNPKRYGGIIHLDELI